MSILLDREGIGTTPGRLPGYPHQGQRVKAVVHGKRGDREIVGTFTGKVACMPGGAVIGFLETDTGARKSVPWTRDERKVEFFPA